DRLVPRGRTKACLGYCMNRLATHAPAIGSYSQAVREGFAPAEGFNNLGWAYLHLGRLDRARKNLDIALPKDPGLQAAYYNRARFHLQKAFGSLGYDLSPGIADIRQALRLGLAGADLHCDAAWLYALAAHAENDSDYLGLALHHLEKARAKGKDLRPLAADFGFRAFKNDRRFRRLTEPPPPSHPPQTPPRLLDPVKDSGRPDHSP